jgi:hypothetical protein
MYRNTLRRLFKIVNPIAVMYKKICSLLNLKLSHPKLKAIVELEDDSAAEREAHKLEVFTLVSAVIYFFEVSFCL